MVRAGGGKGRGEGGEKRVSTSCTLEPVALSAGRSFTSSTCKARGKRRKTWTGAGRGGEIGRQKRLQDLLVEPTNAKAQLVLASPPTRPPPPPPPSSSSNVDFYPPLSKVDEVKDLLGEPTDAKAQLVLATALRRKGVVLRDLGK